MQSLGDYEYGQSDLIGHGAFALVFRGQHKKVRLYTPPGIRRSGVVLVVGCSVSVCLLVCLFVD